MRSHSQQSAWNRRSKNDVNDPRMPQTAVHMDGVDQLIEAFGTRGSHVGIVWKLDVLLDLDRERKPRVLEFFLAVLANSGEATEVRIATLKLVRNGRLSPE